MFIYLEERFVLSLKFSHQPLKFTNSGTTMHSCLWPGETGRGGNQILVLSDRVTRKGTHKRKAYVFAPRQIPFPFFLLLV